MTTVRISTAPVSVAELLDVVDGARVELDESARAAVAAARAVVDEALAAGTAVYGLTTHVGHGRNTRLTDEEVRGEQQFLVLSHSGGVGPPLPVPLVRAALAVRLVGITRGGSGAAVAVAETLAAMLNAGVHPVVPGTGSVGAGDLGQMAGMAQVAIGLGRAEYGGTALDGGEALRRAGIPPLVLGGKDGLALLSANGVSVGSAALVVERAARVAEAADEAAALSMEATGANPSVLHAAVGRAKPVPGQIAAAAHLRELLAGSALFAPDGARSVQDPLSFRVVPQVHGALREYVAATRAAVESELNAAADNPLVSVEDRAMISNGNFHPMVLAIACDALRVAVAHVGQLCERRMAHLWEGFFQRPAGSPAPAYGLQLRYPAAALVAELKQLAAPATLDVPSLDLGVEDHATGAPLSVHKADAALGLLEDLLAIELLLATDVLARTPDRPARGTGTGAVLDLVHRAIAEAEPYPDAVHRTLRERFPGAPGPGSGRRAGAGPPVGSAPMTGVDEFGRPRPPETADETTTLLAFLEMQRATLAWKCGGLDAAGLRATLPPSSMTLGGLLTHMAYVEDLWFSRSLHGRDPQPPWDTVDWRADEDRDWHSAAEHTPDQLVALWQDAVARSRALVDEALADGGLDRLARRADEDGSRPSLRWILFHMIEEYARHVGHADLIRESVDGLTGE